LPRDHGPELSGDGFRPEALPDHIMAPLREGLAAVERTVREILASVQPESGGPDRGDEPRTPGPVPVVPVEAAGVLAAPVAVSTKQDLGAGPGLAAVPPLPDLPVALPDLPVVSVAAVEVAGELPVPAPAPQGTKRAKEHRARSAPAVPPGGGPDLIDEVARAHPAAFRKGAGAVDPGGDSEKMKGDGACLAAFARAERRHGLAAGTLLDLVRSGTGVEPRPLAVAIGDVAVAGGRANAVRQVRERPDEVRLGCGLLAWSAFGPALGTPARALDPDVNAEALARGLARGGRI
jgi:hypothetical protein